ncbi:MAG TPA: septal ring lytic transglycosylase RlpA family protein [Terriglobales bacterium]|nr:septal ring lytic transglycosylase RlpA family protein [Terriglobales bacterium]
MFPFFTLVLVLLLSGCSHQKTAKVNVPPPPAIESESIPDVTPQAKPKQPQEPAATEEEEVIGVAANAKPIFSETGLASWYGPPYHNRRGSNGEIYNMNALTAAHRTVPLGSICRVTNVKTGHSTLVRITDRGPFIRGRVLDLSLAAAKKIDLWKAGVARVKLEVLTSPLPLQTGGRWAVQIGGFDDSKSAADLADHLSRRYHTAQVLKFASPTGAWWIRVRVRDDDKQRAEEVARATATPEGAVFLVRLD